MPSHYIQVGKLKIDQDLMDVICPAAGYTPELICPANGYEKIIPDYVPDAVIPVTETPLSDESIVLICSSQVGGFLSFYVFGGASGISYKIYGNGDVELESGNKTNGTFTYTFLDTMNGYESASGHKYFKLEFKPIGSEHIIHARVSSTGVIYPIIEAYVNAPYITTMNFHGSKLLRKVWLCETMDSLNNATAYSVFKNTDSLEELTMPVSMNAAQNAEGWFNSSALPKIVMPESMIACTSFKYLFQYSKAKELTLPVHIPLMASLDNTFTDMLFIKRIVIPEDIPASIYLNNSFYNCPSLEEIILPSTFVASSGQYAFYNLPKFKGVNYEFTLNIGEFVNHSFLAGNLPLIKKITFIGTLNTPTAHSNSMYGGNTLLEEITLPSSMNGIVTFFTPSALYALKKMNLPLSMTGITSGLTFGQSTTPNIEEISTCETWGTTALAINGAYLKKLKRFDQPTMRVLSITFGQTVGSPGVLEYLDVDFSYLTGNVSLIYNNFSAEELNRIFTALPTITERVLTVNNNPGTATCDRTIATAKGWTCVN